MRSQTGKLIERAVLAEDWAGARQLIRAQLRQNPKDHWLMSRLASTYYEQRKYERALYWDAMALQESPGYGSIYPLREVRARHEKLLARIRP